MAGKTESGTFDASAERVWQAALHVVSNSGYTMLHSDKGSWIMSFNTGRSMSSWGGQDLSLALTAAGSETTVTMGGALARGGMPGGGSQLFAWGEKGRLIEEFLDALHETLPSIPEPEVAPVPSAGGVAAELARLAELHTSGALTDEEFAAAKAKALAN